MNDIELRMECLRLAVEAGASTWDAVCTAMTFMEFIEGGADIGPVDMQVPDVAQKGMS